MSKQGNSATVAYQKAREDVRARQKTILNKFIFDKFIQYREPARKAVSEGKNVGFPKKKYQAALFMLSTYKGSLKQVANGLEVSDGALRKWRSEPAFIETVKQHSKEFTGVFIEWVKKNAKGSLEEYKNFVGNTPLEKLGNFKRSVEYIQEVSDGIFYSPLLVSAIGKEIEKQQKEGLLEINEVCEIICIFKYWSELYKIKSKERVSPELKALLDLAKGNLSATLKASIIDKSIERLKKPKITEFEKREIIVALSGLKKEYE